MNTEEGASLFGSLIGGAVGFYFGGPMGAAIGSSLVGGLAGSIAGGEARAKEQRKLRDAQRKQAKILVEKQKADTAELYSAVQSSVLQQSGAMGAIY